MHGLSLKSDSDGLDESSIASVLIGIGDVDVEKDEWRRQQEQEHDQAYQRVHDSLLLPDFCD